MMTKDLLFTAVILVISNGILALNTTNDVLGENCAVTEPFREHIFNFTDIVSELGYHVDGFEDDAGHYSFNLCRNLSRKCNNQTAAACLKKHRTNEEVVIGYDGKLLWNNGQIRMSYIGEKCKDNTNYTLNVLFHCNYKEDKNDFLGVFHLDNECEVNIVMRTPKACMPIPDNVKNAKLYVKTSPNQMLNFSPLASSNFVVEGKDGKNEKTFIIGFPVLYGHNAACEAGSAVCEVVTDQTNLTERYVNVGMMTSDIKYVKNLAVLELTSDTKCDSQTKRSSKITFICDKLVNEGEPKFVGTEGCSYHFEWATKYACVEEKPCKLTGPNGEIFDFSSIAGIQYKVQRLNKTNEFIHFSLCSPAKECGDMTWGSCLVKTGDNGNRQTTSIGGFTEKLQLDKKDVFLLYENGANCIEHGNKYSTKIEFISADNPQDEEIVLIEDKCQIVLHFKTMLVNQNGKNCIVKASDDSEVSLRPLIDFNGNYEVNGTENESADVRYHLNICRPLNSQYSLDCHGNTAACRTVIKNDKHEEELSLGHFEYVMNAKASEIGYDVDMKYFHGSICPEDKDEHLTTSIKFYCNHTVGLGSPILKSTEACSYYFEFPTNVLCHKEDLSLKKDSCAIEHRGKSVDLKQFGEFTVENMKVDICDNTSKLYSVQYKDSMVVIEYSQHDKDVQVQLKCGLANMTLVDTYITNIKVFHQSTTICPFLNIVPKMMDFVAAPKDSNGTAEEKPKNDEQKHDDAADENASSGFSLGYIFLIIVLIAAFGIFYIVLRNPERREILMNIVKFRSRSNIRYARVNASEESALLTHDLIPSDSDDENILL